MSKDVELAMSILKSCVELFEFTRLKRPDGGRRTAQATAVNSTVGNPDLSAIASRYQSA